MSTWVIVLLGFAFCCVLVFYACIAVNAPKSKEEEQARFEQDCIDADKYMAELKAKHEARKRK